MNPPCTGDETTCGMQFNRSVACYQVPPGFQFGSKWTTQAGVKNVSMSYCPDVATTPAYDTDTGAAVTRGNDGKLVVTTVCPTCNFVSGVQPWQMNTCPCFGSGNYCHISSGTTGVCQNDNSIMCTQAQCPTTATSAPTEYYRTRSRVEKAAAKARKAAVKTATKAQKAASKPVSSRSVRAAAASVQVPCNSTQCLQACKPRTGYCTREGCQCREATSSSAPEPCNRVKCQMACSPNTGQCSKEGCKCLGPMAPSYALPSSLSSMRY